MNIFENITPDTLHHAYAIVGDTSVARIHVFDFLPTINVVAQGNPDVRHMQYDTVTIDIARDLADAVAQKDLGTGKKIFILETNIITEEAQNALLKVFEEPTVGTHFFILMPQNILLPTLRSRMYVINMDNVLYANKSILKKGIAERLELVKEITDGISDDEKTKQDAIALLNQVESELYVRGVEKEAEKLHLCQSTRSALYDRGAPVKMILEQLMVCL